MISFDKPYLVHRDVSNDRFNRVVTAAQQGQSKEAATAMGIWDQIKDFFCGGVKEEALGHLYDLVAAQRSFNGETGISGKSDARSNAIRAFTALKGLTHDSRFGFKAFDENDQECDISSDSIAKLQLTVPTNDGNIEPHIFNFPFPTESMTAYIDGASQRLAELA